FTTLFRLLLPPPPFTLFPYTTLFRSLARSSTVGFLRFSTMVTKRKPTVQKRSQRSKTRSTPKGRTTSPGKKKKTRRYVYYFGDGDRKSTRLNSSHQIISYAVFFLNKK